MDFGEWRGRLAMAAVLAAFAALLVFDRSGPLPPGLEASDAIVGTPTPTPSPAPRLPRGEPDLPEGVRVIPEPEGFVVRDAVVAGELDVPSGRLAVDDYFYLDPPTLVEVPAGTHEVRITRADAVGRGPESRGNALATVVTGPATPRRWRLVGSMGTDGGIGGFASAEAAARMAADGVDPAPLHDRQLALLFAGQRDGVAEVPVGAGLSLFSFNIGYGDGGYRVYAGIDAESEVTRVVLDGGLLHLDWPG